MNDYIKISDFPLVITLVTLGHEVQELERIGRRLNFCFIEDKFIHFAIKEYIEGKILVNPASFYLNFKRIKSQIVLLDQIDNIPLPERQHAKLDKISFYR